MFSGVTTLLPVLVLAAAATAAPAQHQHDHSGTDPTALGVVRFENSCSPEVQEDVGRAMAMLHSFWYEEAGRQFRRITTRDTSCVIAHWGVAMAQWQPLWEPRGPGRDALARGRAALEEARQIGGGTAREREYLAALEEFFARFDSVDHTDRVLAYEKAMAALSAKYPADPEASIFYALALLASATTLPPDKTYVRQKKAGELLEPIFGAQASHPGVAHYIIHAYDYPPLAARALDAARRYAEVAPDSPHAQHMPSHIFTRLGLWQESIASNENVVRTAQKHNVPGEEFHGRDYLVFAHLQRGDDERAKAAMLESPKLADLPPGATLHFASLYAAAAMPARYAVERRQWAEAAALPEPTGFPGGRYAWADAAIYFARALGAARSGKIDQARRDLDHLKTLHRTLIEHKEDYWATQVEVQQRGAAAWLLLAQGRRDEALDAMRAAADLEESTDKHPVTPGQIVPARDLLGQMLLDLERPAEAIGEFERVLHAEPNRFGALAGAARAAELAGRTADAKRFYAKLLEIAPESTRAEVRRARAVLEGTTPES